VAEVSLTPTSYLVLGLVGHLGGATSYELKASVGKSIGYFWTFPHSQLYAEPARLVSLGLLSEDTETTGRRRRTYSLTPSGRVALDEWLAEPTETATEIRDLALLKLFFGSQSEPKSVRSLAVAQQAGHRSLLEQYEHIAKAMAEHPGVDAHHRRTLEMGLRFERAAVSFWQQVEADADDLASDPD
jgi:PadR family transcriptional regulator AphA